MLQLIAARTAAWPMIALSSRPDVSVAVDAMKLGAQDYLQKPLSAAALSGGPAPSLDGA